MKRIVFFWVFLTSCQSYDKNLKSMRDKVQKDLIDASYRYNFDIKIEELTPIKYDTLSYKEYNEFKRRIINEKYIYYENKVNSLVEIMNLKLEQAKLMKMIGSDNNTLKLYTDEIKKQNNKVQMYIDSLNLCLKKDSLLVIESNNKNVDSYYLFKALLKAKIKIGDKDRKHFDTITHVFDKKLEIIKFDNILK